MTNDTIMLDTPDQIEAFRIIATVKGLELEIKWGARGTPTRGMALASGRRIMAQYGIPGPCGTRRTCHRSLHAWATQQGLLREEDNKPKEVLDRHTPTAL